MYLQLIVCSCYTLEVEGGNTDEPLSCDGGKMDQRREMDDQDLERKIEETLQQGCETHHT